MIFPWEQWGVLAAKLRSIPLTLAREWYGTTCQKVFRSLLGLAKKLPIKYSVMNIRPGILPLHPITESYLFQPANND